MSTNLTNESTFDNGNCSMLNSTLPKPIVQKSSSVIFNAALKPRAIRDIKFNPDYRTYEKMVLREPGGEYHTDSELREVYTCMLTNQYFKPFESKPGYEKYRRVLVDWMCEIGDTIKQSFTTIHHSVCIMDIYFSKLDDIESNNRGKRLLKLVALT